MEKKIISGLVLCFVLVFMSNTLAQEYKYDINKYYTPDIVRNSLDLSFSSNDNIRNYEHPNDSTIANSLEWNLNPTFTRYKNTRKQITTFSIGGQTNGSSNSYFKTNKNNFKTSLNTENNLSINYNSYFYTLNQFFLMFKVSGNYGGTYYKDINSTDTLVRTNFASKNTYQLRPYIGVGKGRIESITDARQAVYILEELSKKRRITRILSENEIFKFAQIISKIKNKRFLDARLRKIEEITTVDSFLVENGYLTKQDATYFTTLNDLWEYGALYSRNSGQSFEINLSPNLNFASSHEKQTMQNLTQTTKDQIYNAELNFIYRYEKSTSLDWQHSFSTSLSFHISDISNEKIYDSGFQDKTIAINKGGRFDANYDLSYFPSTRSKFTFYANQIYTLDFNDHITSNNNEYPQNHVSSLMTSVGVSTDYYFSPQLRLSGSAGVGYRYDSQSTNNYTFKQISAGIGASINYSFF